MAALPTLTGQTQSSSVPASHLTGEGTEAQREEVTSPMRPSYSAAEPGPEPMFSESSVFTQATLPLVWSSPFLFLFKKILFFITPLGF